MRYFKVSFTLDGKAHTHRVHAANPGQGAEFGVSMADPSSSGTDQIIVEVEEMGGAGAGSFEVAIHNGPHYQASGDDWRVNPKVGSGKSSIS